jgi:hypothetical protein
MRGQVQFVTLARRYDKADLVRPLEPFGGIADLPEDATENVLYYAISGRGHVIARCFWKFLRDLPEAVGATPEEFALGYKPVGPGNGHSADLNLWDGWLHRF